MIFLQVESLVPDQGFKSVCRWRALNLLNFSGFSHLDAWHMFRQAFLLYGRRNDAPNIGCLARDKQTRRCLNSITLTWSP